MTNPAPALPRVLSIAGTDPTGGAGIQADIKSIGAAGGFAMSVVTALVAQNTHGVRSIHTPGTGFLVEQLDAVFDDVTVDAVKIGMLGTAEITDVIADYLAAHPVPVVVVDPVMVATSGDRLLTEDAEAALVELCRAADVITPNLAELGVLCGSPGHRIWTRRWTRGVPSPLSWRPPSSSRVDTCPVGVPTMRSSSRTAR